MEHSEMAAAASGMTGWLSPLPGDGWLDADRIRRQPQRQETAFTAGTVRLGKLVRGKGEGRGRCARLAEEPAMPLYQVAPGVGSERPRAEGGVGGGVQGKRGGGTELARRRGEGNKRFRGGWMAGRGEGGTLCTVRRASIHLDTP